MKVRPDLALLVFGTNRRWIALALSLLVVAMASVGHAAIIGPTNDWVSITDRPKEWNISDEMVDEVLAAGLNLYCEGSENANPGTTNAWLLSGDRTTITTVAHVFYDEHGKERAP